MWLVGSSVDQIKDPFISVPKSLGYYGTKHLLSSFRLFPTSSSSDVRYMINHSEGGKKGVNVNPVTVDLNIRDPSLNLLRGNCFG